MSQQAYFFDTTNQRWMPIQYTVPRAYGFPYRYTASQRWGVMYGLSTQSIWEQNPGVASDGTDIFLRRWQTPMMAGSDPMRVFTVERVAFDYQSNATSSVSIIVFQDRGVSSSHSTLVTLPPSLYSRAEVAFFVPSRYPVVEFQSSATTHALYRAEIGLVAQGR